MTSPSYLLLFVDSPEASAAFYARLLGTEPVEVSPTFVLFAFPTGLKLGLWSRHTAEPRPDGVPGAGELGLAVADAAAVDEAHARWAAQGATILQPPVTAEFGRTFLAADPDGHRLRVFAPPAE